MHAKGDEAGYECDSCGIKFRVIISTPLYMQVQLQPWVRAAGDRLKAVFANVLVVSGTAYHFTYASGANASTLTQWRVDSIERAQQQINSLIVMGDDSLFCDIGTVNNRHPLVVREIDYSKFDQSQKNNHLHAEQLVLEALGVPNRITAYLLKLCALPSRHRNRDPRVNIVITLNPGKNRCRRVSGAPDTSLGNSIVNIIGYLIAHRGNFSAAAWKRAGLIPKYHRTSPSFEGMTFLRGMWLPYHDSPPRWTPLPSQLLKLGKIVYGDVPLSPRKTAMFARGLASSFQGVDRSTPLLGPFLAAYDRLGTEPDARVARALASQRRYGISLLEQPFKIDRKAAIAIFCDRYEITHEDITRVERTFQAITHLPVFYGDPLFTALSADYR
jgi:hypothetical protein